MQLSRCGTALVILVCGTGVFTWIFDDMYSLIICFSLILLLFFRAALFSRKTGIVLGSLDVFRDAEKTMIKKGGHVRIKTSVKCRIPPGTTVCAHDILPGVARIVNGKDSVTGKYAGICSMDFLYTVAYLSTGYTGIRGIDIEIKDSFFTSRFPFRGPRFQGPPVWVEPVGIFQKGEASDFPGEYEDDRRSPLRGSGVVSFRDYTTGDDPRSIDWKMTAKHAKLVVREYAGLYGAPSLMVIDVSGSYGELRNSWDRMVGSLIQAFKETVRENGKCSLVIISGMNLVRYLPEESSLSRVRSVIAENRSYPGLVHAYRTLNSGMARNFLKHLQGSGRNSAEHAATSLYIHNLSNIIGSFLPKMHPSLFDVQLARTLKSGKAGRMYIFSLFQGDQSHIRALIYQSRLRGVRVSCELPEAVACPGLIADLRALGADDIQVIK